MYSTRSNKTLANKRNILIILLILIISLLLFLMLPRVFKKTKSVVNSNRLNFDSSVSQQEQEQITKAISDKNITLSDNTTVSVKTVTSVEDTNSVLSAYVLATGLYASRQSINNNKLATLEVKVSQEVDETIIPKLAEVLGISTNKIEKQTSNLDASSKEIIILPAKELNAKQKLLMYNDSYYLDKFNSGAIFRVASFSNTGSEKLREVKLNDLPNQQNIAKINQTGVTALTRLMMRKLNEVKDPLYFSKYIGPVLKDADLTHISNEVSFKQGCTYHDAVFCSDPRFIETIKDSGVDLVELTGNHNNDAGRQYNADTINLYKQLGIATFGGGLNTEEAKKFYTADIKGNKVAFLGYNHADSPSGGPIASSTEAGANSFDYSKIKNDIQAAKQQAQFVIVDVQFAECYSYPDGYVEYPICNLPINGQQETFRKISDLGADMVIGSQAHQSQIYEQYQDKMIYYGLGNLYFDQTQWPGTERGIILTHYFKDGKLLQTKLTPTIYDAAFQTKPMADQQATKFLDFLNNSR